MPYIPRRLRTYPGLNMTPNLANVVAAVRALIPRLGKNKTKSNKNQNKNTKKNNYNWAQFKRGRDALLPLSVLTIPIARRL
jgi:hypothetical protein